MDKTLEPSRKEIWKPISGYKKFYEISNQGRVKSLKRDVVRNQFNKTDRILKTTIYSNGYLLVDLRLNGVKKHFLVHRLVAQHFMENKHNKPQVNHKDGNKSNNCVENLEWVTSRENNIHAIDTLLNKSEKKVSQLSLSGVLIKKWRSMSDAERSLQIGKGSVSRCCSGAYDSAGGFKWSYA